jgi:hypothetical protein
VIRVILPFGGDCPYRQRSLTWVWENLPQLLPEATLHVGECDGPWSKATAVANAIDPDWDDDDVLVIHDADVWAPKLPDTVLLVSRKGRSWAAPHTMVHRLGPDLTERVMTGEIPFGGLGTAGLDQPPYQGVVGGGCVVLSRAAYRRVPLDPRFVGWGQEDESWGFALHRIFGPPHQQNHRLYHLWHPHPERRSRRVGNDDGEKLRNRYRAAKVLKDDMERLLDEFRLR